MLNEIERDQILAMIDKYGPSGFLEDVSGLLTDRAFSNTRITPLQRVDRIIQAGKVFQLCLDR